MEIQGKLVSKGVEETFGEKLFKVRKFMIDLSRFDQNTGQEYPNAGEFQLTQGNCALLDTFVVGDKVKVEFNISGRFYQKKDKSGDGFAQNLVAFKLTLVEKGTQPVEVSSASIDDESDSLPF